MSTTDKAGWMDRIGHGLLKCVRWVDENLRYVDFHVHRTCGGYLSPFNIQRQSPGFLLFPPFVCFALVAGTGALDLRLVYASITAVIIPPLLLLLAQVSRKKNTGWDMAIQLGPIMLVATLVWTLGSDNYQDNKLYRHGLVLIVWILCASLALAAFLVRWLFKDLITVSEYPAYLRATELFQSYGPDRTATLGQTVAAALAAPLRAPLQLLWLPSVVALVAWPAWLIKATVIAAIFSYLALVVAGIDDRFAAVWTLFQRALFRGGSLVVSFLVIGFAITRLARVSYVTTVLDGAAAQAILFALSALYVLSWWSAYWLERLLSNAILALVAGPQSAPKAVNEAFIDYSIAQPHTSVAADERVLQIHGSSRFLALRDDPDSSKVRFQAHTAEDLIELLANTGAPGGKAKPLPSQIAARAYTYTVLVAFFMLGIAGLGAWMLHEGPQSPELETTSIKAAGVNLDTFLSDEAREKEGRPLIVMAASGGGTRAALFTASVLRAIWKQNAARDMVLGSGISGGGAALAYFASERNQLINATAEKPWDDYIDTMRQPFIEDVLTKATEWRMIGPGRLGSLLSESFMNRWHLPPTRNTFGALNDFGLILNTSLTGHLDCKDAKVGHCGDSLIYLEQKSRDSTRSKLAGSRLIFTNLKVGQFVTLDMPEGNGIHNTPVVINGPNIRLETAAAINANFPPVFSDAGVDIYDEGDVEKDTRYWVTDGGAIDNRGMETLLYALRHTLKERGEKNERLPRMVVLIADASGYSPKFSQDRGAAAALAGGSKMASQLASELIDSLQRLYCAHGQTDDFGFEYLLMPDELRSSDSFGTHWMLQPRITLRHETAPGQKDERTIRGEEMVQVLKYLYTDETPELSSDAQVVLNWSRAAKGAWTDLVAGLKPGGKLPGSGRATCVEVNR